MNGKIGFVGAVMFLTVSGCSQDPGFVRVSGVQEAMGAEVAQCAYLTDIRATPPVYGALADQGLQYARNRILADVRDAGGNTAVFDPAPPGAAVYELHAVAYRC